MTKVYRDREAVDYVLSRLQAVGLYDGNLDGALGPKGQAGLEKALAAYVSSTSGLQIGSPGDDPRLAWGARVSRMFRDRVHWMVEALEMPKETGANDLMSCMAWESNETFSPSIKNMAGSGATGLIQFMPATAIALGTTVHALAAMTAEDQLNYVYKYFQPYKGRLKNLGDLYMAILWPKGVGKPDDYVLWEKGKMPTTYRQNSGLDINRDGTITRAEAVAKVKEKLARGFLEGNVHQ
jgi:hypothetical protein